MRLRTLYNPLRPIIVPPRGQFYVAITTRDVSESVCFRSSLFLAEGVACWTAAFLCAASFLEYGSASNPSPGRCAIAHARHRATGPLAPPEHLGPSSSPTAPDYINTDEKCHWKSISNTGARSHPTLCYAHSVALVGPCTAATRRGQSERPISSWESCVGKHFLLPHCCVFFFSFLFLGSVVEARKRGNLTSLEFLCFFYL